MELKKIQIFSFWDCRRDKITGTITDTLKRTNKRKKSKAAHDIPNFLFVNKPHFSSEESLNNGAVNPLDIMVNGGGAFSRPSSRGESPSQTKIEDIEIFKILQAPAV